MEARTADPTFFPILPAICTDLEKLAGNCAATPIVNDPLGAFRGLVFAVIFEVLFVIIGIGAWEVLRRLF
jgi:hypothetical protein